MKIRLIQAQRILRSCFANLGEAVHKISCGNSSEAEIVSEFTKSEDLFNGLKNMYKKCQMTHKRKDKK